MSAEYFLLGNKKSKLDLGCARLLLQYLPLLITIKGVQSNSQIYVTVQAGIAIFATADHNKRCTGSATVHTGEKSNNCHCQSCHCNIQCIKIKGAG